MEESSPTVQSKGARDVETQLRSSRKLLRGNRPSLQIADAHGLSSESPRKKKRKHENEKCPPFRLDNSTQEASDDVTPKNLEIFERVNERIVRSASKEKELDSVNSDAANSLQPKDMLERVHPEHSMQLQEPQQEDRQQHQQRSTNSRRVYEVIGSVLFDQQKSTKVCEDGFRTVGAFEDIKAGDIIKYKGLYLCPVSHQPTTEPEFQEGRVIKVTYKQQLLSLRCNDGDMKSLSWKDISEVRSKSGSSSSSPTTTGSRDICSVADGLQPRRECSNIRRLSSSHVRFLEEGENGDGESDRNVSCLRDGKQESNDEFDVAKLLADRRKQIQSHRSG